MLPASKLIPLVDLCFILPARVNREKSNDLWCVAFLYTVAEVFELFQQNKFCIKEASYSHMICRIVHFKNSSV